MSIAGAKLGKTPAKVPVQSMVIDFVIETPPPPKSPASRQLMKPPAFVLARAPLNVRHGAPSVHALASFPVRETQDRSLPACAGRALSRRHARPARVENSRDFILVALQN